MWAAYTPPRAREASAGEKTLKFSKHIGKINENHWFFSKMAIFPPRRRISQIFRSGSASAVPSMRVWWRFCSVLGLQTSAPASAPASLHRSIKNNYKKIENMKIENSENRKSRKIENSEISKSENFRFFRRKFSMTFLVDKNVREIFFKST